MPSSEQTAAPTKKFRLGRLHNLGLLLKAGAQTLKAMADGTITPDLGSKLMNGIGIMRMCMETKAVEDLGTRLDKLETDQGTDHVDDRYRDRDGYRHQH